MYDYAANIVYLDNDVYSKYFNMREVEEPVIDASHIMTNTEQKNETGPEDTSLNNDCNHDDSMSCLHDLDYLRNVALNRLVPTGKDISVPSENAIDLPLS